MKLIKGFTGDGWWRQTNPAFRQACFRKNVTETVELKGKYDYFIKQTNK